VLVVDPFEDIGQAYKKEIEESPTKVATIDLLDSRAPKSLK